MRFRQQDRDNGRVDISLGAGLHTSLFTILYEGDLFVRMREYVMNQYKIDAFNLLKATYL